MLCACLPAPAHAAGRLQDDPADPKVWNLDIRGNTTFKDMVIKNQIATVAASFWQKLKFWNRSGYDYDDIEVRKDVIRIERFYQRRGFDEVQVSREVSTGNKPWKKNVTFIIHEQKPIRIRQVSYVCNADSTTEHLILDSKEFEKTRDKQAYQPGNRYEIVKKPDVVGAYETTLKTLGYPYADMHIYANVDSAMKSADLLFEVDPGPRAYIDTIKVEGEQHIPKRLVRRQTGLNKGDRFNQKKLQEAQRQLFNHHLFRFATISIPKQPHDSTLNLQVRVRENAERSVEIRGGIGTEEKIRGQASWTHRNVFHRGHKFTASLRASFIEQRLSVDYLFPYVYNPKSNLVFTPFVQHMLEPSFELWRLGMNNSLVYQYSRNLTGSISYELTRNMETTVSSNTSLPDSTRSYNISALQLSGYYGQGFLRNQQGWVIQPFAEVSGLFGSAAFQFEKLSLDVRRYINLSPSTTLASRVQGGTIFYTQSDSLPGNIRFFLGGTNTVRGWSRQSLGPKRPIFDEQGNFVRYVPIGGRAMFNFNLEIRQQIHNLIPRIGLAAFLDGGQVWRDLGRAGRRPVQFGIGGGIRYSSPIGPVRVDVGYKLNPSPEDLARYNGTDHGNAWDKIGIHFSIGQAF